MARRCPQFDNCHTSENITRAFRTLRQVRRRNPSKEFISTVFMRYYVHIELVGRIFTNRGEKGLKLRSRSEKT